MEFSGKAVVHLAADPKVIKKTGKILMTTDLGKEYKFKEDDGSFPASMTSMSSQLAQSGHTWLAAITPGSIPMPKSLLHLKGNKF